MKPVEFWQEYWHVGPCIRPPVTLPPLWWLSVEDCCCPWMHRFSAKFGSAIRWRFASKWSNGPWPSNPSTNRWRRRQTMLFFWSGVRIPLGTEKNSFTYFPYLCRTWKILSSEYSANETAWILTGVLTRSPVYPAYLIPRRFQGVLDYTHSVVNNHGTYADLNSNPNPIPNPYKSTAH